MTRAFLVCATERISYCLGSKSPSLNLVLLTKPQQHRSSRTESKNKLTPPPSGPFRGLRLWTRCAPPPTPSLQPVHSWWLQVSAGNVFSEVSKQRLLHVRTKQINGGHRSSSPNQFECYCDVIVIPAHFISYHHTHFMNLFWG